MKRIAGKPPDFWTVAVSTEFAWSRAAVGPSPLCSQGKTTESVFIAAVGAATIVSGLATLGAEPPSPGRSQLGPTGSSAEDGGVTAEAIGGGVATLGWGAGSLIVGAMAGSGMLGAGVGSGIGGGAAIVGSGVIGVGSGAAGSGIGGAGSGIGAGARSLIGVGIGGVGSGIGVGVGNSVGVGFGAPAGIDGDEVGLLFSSGIKFANPYFGQVGQLLYY